jgi:hypothetical protein
VKDPASFILARFLGAEADSARVAIAIDRMHEDEAPEAEESLRTGLPRLTTIHVVPEEVGPSGVKLDEASRGKLVAAGVDPDLVERELHGMKRGDMKELAEVVYGAKSGTPRSDVDEQLRWYGIAPTEDEEERIARGETVTFLVGADQSPA